MGIFWTQKTRLKPAPFSIQMGDANEFQVCMGMGISIVFENGHGHRYEYEFLKSKPDYVPDLLVKWEKNMLKPKNKC